MNPHKTPSSSIYAPNAAPETSLVKFEQTVRRAFTHLREKLQECMPTTAPQAFAWMAELTPDGIPEDRFLAPSMFPMHRLPWWFEQSLAIDSANDRELSFQSDLAYATINGYYYLRLIDNLMDGDDRTERKILPVSAFFHTELQSTYQRHFSSGHAFWDHFHRDWLQGFSAVMREASLQEIDEETWSNVSALKYRAVHIPLTAVAYRYDRLDRLDAWRELSDRIACLWQALDDLLDHRQDAEQGRATYLLSVAAEQERPLDLWMLDEGLHWARRELDRRLAEVRAAARPCDHPPLNTYLDSWADALDKRCEEMGSAFGSILRLTEILNARHDE